MMAMLMILCECCLSAFPEDALIDKLKPVKTTANTVQKDARCPNPGCNTVIYRTVKGTMLDGSGKSLPMNGRVPASRAQQDIMEAEGVWPPSDWPEAIRMTEREVVNVAPEPVAPEPVAPE